MKKVSDFTKTYEAVCKQVKNMLKTQYGTFLNYMSLLYVNFTGCHFSSQKHTVTTQNTMTNWAQAL